MSQAATGLDLRQRVQACVSAGRPLGADLFSALAAANGPQLYHAFLPTRVREVLWHPSPEMAKHARRAAFLGREHLGLTWMFRRKLNKGTTRPSLYRVLTALRCQCGKLLSELPEDTARRVRHVLQVQLTPPLVREKLLGLTGVAFTTSRRSMDLPERPVPLSACRAQWLHFYRPAQAQEFITARLRESDLRVDPLTNGVLLTPEQEWDFSYLPVPGGREYRKLLPSERIVTYETALAIHEGVEMAVVTGVGRSHQLFTPRIYVGTETPEDFSARDMTPELIDLCAQSLTQWWLAYRDVDPATLPRDDSDLRLDPWAWARYLTRDEVRSRMMYPTDSAEGYLQQLGDDGWAGLAEAVFRSHQLRWGKHALIPLCFFNPASSQDPVHRCSDRLYAIFTRELRGRDTCAGGVLQRLPLASAIQVLEPAPAGDPEDATNEDAEEAA